jgi:hypothetical protein
MLIIGDIQPTNKKWPTGHPQFRGILLDGNRFGTDLNGLTQTIPEGAVQTGWYACVSDGLRFAPLGEIGGHPLPPAILPPLSSIGYKLWRRIDSAFALTDNTRRIPDKEWDTYIKKSMETPLAPLMFSQIHG